MEDFVTIGLTFPEVQPAKAEPKKEEPKKEEPKTKKK